MLVWLSLLMNIAAAAPPVTVCGDGSCDFDDLQAAIDSKPARIAAGPGPWQGPFELSTVIGLQPLDPSSPPRLTCDDRGVSTVTLKPITSNTPEAPPQTTFVRFTVEACPGGRALYLSGNTSDPDLATSVLLIDSTLTGGVDPTDGPDRGGLVYVAPNALLHVETSELRARAVEGGGGHVYLDKDARLRAIDTRFLEGTASSGGSVYADVGSRVAVSSSTFEQNAVLGSGRGGALFLTGVSQLYVGDSRFEDNSAYDGGALSLSSGIYPVDALVERTLFQQNTARNGGAWMLIGTEIAALDNTFLNNNALWQETWGVGGAIYTNDSTLHLRGSRLEDNSARKGGAIHALGGSAAGLIDIASTQFLGNRADRDGGGTGGAIDIYNPSTAWPLHIQGSTFFENVALGSGGALATQQVQLTAAWSSFEQNQGKNGGAWYDEGPSTEQHHNLYCENIALSGFGGVGYLDGNSTVVLHHNLATGNVASGGAGVFYIRDSGDVFVGNHHFIANSASQAGNSGSAVIFKDSYGSAPNNLFQGGVGSEGMTSLGTGYVLGGPQVLWHAPYPNSFTVPARSMNGSITLTVDPQPKGLWESGKCTRDLFSEENNTVYGAGVAPDSSGERWPVGAFHDTIFGNSDVDLDEDGHGSQVDCDDWNPEIYPSAPELACDGVDQDCEDPCTTGGLTCAPGELRDGATPWYRDLDQDGTGDNATEVLSCDHPAALPGTLDPADQWYVTTAGDCNDNDADVTTEALYWPDADGDGAGGATDLNGQALGGVLSCSPPDGFVANNLDCADDDADVNPDAAEICDGIDNNCSGAIDLDPVSGGSALIPDADGDGYGEYNAQELQGCAGVSGFTAASNTGDCDDSDATRNPGVEEVCDDVDQNCNGIIDADEAVDRLTYYVDDDGDDYGVTTSAQQRCTALPNLVQLDGDCDDSSNTIFPGAVESCNGKNDDCDDETDEEAVNGFLAHADSDGDSYGAPEGTLVCAYTNAFISDSSDCDDTDDRVHPGTSEICNGVDDNCSGTIDDSPTDGDLFYADEDSDGYGNPSLSVVACEAPGGHTAISDDCDDANSNIHPNAPEDCSQVDRDCNGDPTAAAVDQREWFEDADGDGFGNGSVDQSSCEQPPGFVETPTDCDDADPQAFPGAPGYDADCARVGRPQVVLLSGGGCSTPGPGAPGWLVLLGVLLPLRRRVSA